LEPVTAVENYQRFHATQTHCKWGHPFSGPNLYRTDRQRYCRECGRLRMRKFRAKK
jgi:hypothetical protein